VTAVEYLDTMPHAIPEGRILVHNHVRPTRHVNSRGFRAWLDNANDDRYTKCDCSWTPELGDHYRVAGVRPYRTSGEDQS
jgi:hypothetical protein